MELDARTAPDGTALAADICIVGAGPAGLALAHQLHSTGRHVVLLDSGSYGRDSETDQLNAGECTGDPYQELDQSRCRAVGGTSVIWNNVLEGSVFGKYVPLDGIDFEPRSWIEWSGWPISRCTLDPYYEKAQQVCGLGAFAYRGSEWTDPQHPLLPLTDALTNTIYQYGSAARFRVDLAARLVSMPAVTLVRGATVTDLMQSASGDRLTGVRWAALTGTGGTVTAPVFVLAAGGIENARLLLNALGDSPWLGRGFMEHPIDTSLHLVSRSPAIHPAPAFYAHHPTTGGVHVEGRIGLSRELMMAERLRNASLRFLGDDEPRLWQAPALRPAGRRLIPSQRLRRAITRQAARLSRRLRPARYQLLMDLEQGPHPDNRIVLSNHRDALGQRRPALHWRWREADQANLVRLRSIVAGELERAGAGRVRTIASAAINPNAHHHAGTTRMSTDRAHGVVDENLRFHRMENLFVTGSSVFPTAGVANPTLTAIALTLRLADHLAPGVSR